MSRWPRLIFAGYSILVLVAIACRLWPFPSSLFQQWRTSNVAKLDLGPIQSNNVSDGSLERVLASSRNGPLVSGTRRTHAESEIAVKTPQIESARFSMSALAVDDGIFYFASGPWIYAVEEDGRLRWSFRPGGSSLAATRILVSRQLVFFSSGNGRVFCFDKSGRLQWFHSLGGEDSDFEIVLGESNIIAAIVSREGTRLEALSAVSGERQWTSDFFVGASSGGLAASGSRVVLYSAKSYWVVDSQSGRALSDHAVSDEISSAVYSTELDLLITKSTDGNYRALAASTGRVLWMKVPSKTTSRWMSAIVRSANTFGFWALGARNLAIFREIQSGSEVDEIRSRSQLGGYAALDVDSLVVVRADQSGLLRFR